MFHYHFFVAWLKILNKTEIKRFLHDELSRVNCQTMRPRYFLLFLIFVKERLWKTVEQTSPQTSVTNEGPITQCCGSGMFKPDQGQKDSGSASKT